jgi:hypothetical protein
VSLSRCSVLVIATCLSVLGTFRQSRGDDCNANDTDDACDLSCEAPGCAVPGCGESSDCNENGNPDECEWRSLYAGTQDGGGSAPAGVFQYDGGEVWTDISPVPNWDAAVVMSLVWFDGHLYAGGSPRTKAVP